MLRKASSNITVLPAPVGAVITTFRSVWYKSRKATDCALLKCLKLKILWKTAADDDQILVLVSLFLLCLPQYSRRHVTGSCWRLSVLSRRAATRRNEEDSVSEKWRLICCSSVLTIGSSSRVHRDEIIRCYKFQTNRHSDWCKIGRLRVGDGKLMSSTVCTDSYTELSSLGGKAIARRLRGTAKEFSRVWSEDGPSWAYSRLLLLLLEGW